MAATENSTLLQTLLAKVNALQEKLDNVPSPRQSSKLQVPKDCQKVERRKRALAAICWSPSTKKDVEGILNPSFTSPEKSDDELGGRYRIPFIWESSTLARKKRALDEKYRNDVLKTDQARRQLCFVTDHPSESILKTPPKDSPTWVISSRYEG
ncbi:hypothetical protein FSP39_006898 [Pinctada imbricata]|uniref:Uncharacterized protein n=1 Tax=Pinctada imbricata TaxID=66713 RepID=A0AA89CAL0_PINIB|nr:hypothetical protein FSP39_006898 [Pinctada imbricata]